MKYTRLPLVNRQMQSRGGSLYTPSELGAVQFLLSFFHFKKKKDLTFPLNSSPQQGAAAAGDGVDWRTTKANNRKKSNQEVLRRVAPCLFWVSPGVYSTVFLSMAVVCLFWYSFLWYFKET